MGINRSAFADPEVMKSSITRVKPYITNAAVNGLSPVVKEEAQ